MGNTENIPQHVGFIMDGNGRWAKAKGLDRNEGHIAGAENVKKVVRYCFRKGIKVVSLYTFSSENWLRPKAEVDKLMSLLQDFLTDSLAEFSENGIKLLISGEIDRLPKKLAEICKKRIDETKNNKNGTLNIALSYGSRDEIIRACNLLVKEGVKKVTAKNFEEKLYTYGLPDIDLVVRTSGEIRLSNFFLYQAAYAELYFTDVLWPDFDEKEIDKAIEWYLGRNRRFGKV